MSRQHIDIYCISVVRSPLTHMSGAEGNKSVVMRESIMTDMGARSVPCLSGNALRFNLVRKPGMRDLINRWELSGKINLPQLNFLMHGGSLTKKGGRVSLGDQHDLYRLFPVLRLIGCSLPGQIVSGCLQAWRGMLACRENRPRIMSMLPDALSDLIPRDLRPAVSQIGEYQYTRSGASKSAPDVITDDADGDATDKLMIMQGQMVKPGAIFVHGFTVQFAGELDLGALIYCLRLWIAAGATIGGMASKGHGRLSTSIWCEDSLDQDGLCRAYVDHVDSVKDEGVEYLHRLFDRLPDPDSDPEESEEPATEPEAKPAKKRRARRVDASA